MNPFIKICGITSIADAKMVCNYSPAYLGFIFHKPSPRNIEISILKEISIFVRHTHLKKIKLIGVFVNPSISDIESRSKFLDGFQLHGEESPDFCKEIQKKFPEHEVWKAFRIKEEDDLHSLSKYSDLKTLLIDAFSDKKNEYGGSGKTVDKKILQNIQKYILPSQKFIIAGGITAKNKKEIIELSDADGIDLSSGIEISAGKKSEDKLKEFFNKKK